MFGSGFYSKQLLLSTSGGTGVWSLVTGSSEFLVPGRVTASANIPQGAVTGALEPQMLLGQPDIQQISVGLGDDGLISLEEKCKQTWYPDIHWVRALRLSDDCHSFNVQLKVHQTQGKPAIILQAVRPIQVGQELLLWFSEEVLAMLKIAFLTPANIQGHKKYVCTRCLALYESPNPLKLHMTLNCGRLAVFTLWKQLYVHIRESSQTNLYTPTSFELKLSPQLHYTTPRSAEHFTLAPLRKVVQNERHFRSFHETMLDSTVATPLLTIPPAGAQDYSDEAQKESLVSSLGKSKHGHICLYCGKCYSRKYGLKIHLRTHTGYKPLKCRICGRPFGDPSNLNKHLRLHAEGNTPYKCDLCDKILTRRRDLMRHLKSRHMADMHPDANVDTFE